MNRYVLSAALLIVAAIGFALSTDDAQARAARHAGCSGAVGCAGAEASCSSGEGWYLGKRRHERREARAARHAAYGCSGVAAACAGAHAATCAGEMAPPPCGENAVPYDQIIQPQVSACPPGVVCPAPEVSAAPPAPPVQ